jgi:hypothetical protein
VRQRPEDKGEDEARDESSDQRRVMRHRGSSRYPRRAKPSSRVAEPNSLLSARAVTLQRSEWCDQVSDLQSQLSS